MPIYTNKLNSQKFKVVIKIDIQEFEKLLINFKKAKETFPYKNKYYFLKSIELDEAGKSLEFYNIKVTIDYLAGTDLSKVEDKFPFISKFYNDPKLNINDYNYTLMMESLIKQANSLLPRNSKYIYDIIGSWTNGKVILLEKK
jgi:hypothetical protein